MTIIARKRRRLAWARYQPNLTPLIDVLFLLLLFFLLGTRLRVEEGQIPASLPQVSAGASITKSIVPPLTLRVLIRPAGESNEQASYDLGDGQPLRDATTLYEQLAARSAGSADVLVQISPQSHVRWEFVVEAFNQAVRAGFQKIAFAPVDG